jgi:hypothetical protein
MTFIIIYINIKILITCNKKLNFNIIFQYFFKSSNILLHNDDDDDIIMIGKLII